MTAALTPPEAAIGLDLFAAAWLDRWNSYDGHVTVETSGRVLAGAYLNEPDPDPNDPHPDWTDAAFRGATRELLELLRLVPGGKEALAAHVAQFPTHRGEGVFAA